MSLVSSVLSLSLINLPLDIYYSLSKFLGLSDIINLTSLSRQLYILRQNKLYNKYLSKNILSENFVDDIIFSHLIKLNNLEENKSLNYAVLNGYEKYVMMFNTPENFENLRISESLECKYSKPSIFYYIRCIKLQKICKQKFFIDKLNPKRSYFENIIKDSAYWALVRDKIFTFEIAYLCGYNKYNTNIENYLERLKLLEHPDFEKYVTESYRSLFTVVDIPFLKLCNLDITSGIYNSDILISNNLELIKYGYNLNILDRKLIQTTYDNENKAVIEFLFDNSLLQSSWSLLKNIFLAENVVLFKSLLRPLISINDVEDMNDIRDIYSDNILRPFIRKLEKNMLLKTIDDILKTKTLEKIRRFISCTELTFWEKNKKNIINKSLKLGRIDFVRYLLETNKIEKRLISRNAINYFLRTNIKIDEIKYILDTFAIRNILGYNIDNILRYYIRISSIKNIKYLFETLNVTKKNRVLLKKMLEYAINRNRKNIVDYINDVMKK